MSRHLNTPDGTTPLRVSLVTPTFNQANYLAAAVNSVLAQTHTDIEYIVINDGSTDNTVDVLRSFGDSLRSVTQANAGQAQTLNRGWALATGDILGYLSSDDLLKPDAVARAVAALRENPRAVASYCDFDLIDDIGIRVRTVLTEDFSKQRLIRDLVCLPGPGAFFRRHAFEASGGWNPQLRQIPDFDFWMRLSRLGPFVRIPAVLAEYRIHPESASYRTTTPARADEIIHAVDAYWQGSTADSLSDEAASRAMSRLIAARTHFSAGRLAAGVAHVLHAWRMAPARALQALSWRILVGGLLRRSFYGMRELLGRGRS